MNNAMEVRSIARWGRIGAGRIGAGRVGAGQGSRPTHARLIYVHVYNSIRVAGGCTACIHAWMSEDLPCPAGLMGGRVAPRSARARGRCRRHMTWVPAAYCWAAAEGGGGGGGVGRGHPRLVHWQRGTL